MLRNLWYSDSNQTKGAALSDKSSGPYMSVPLRVWYMFFNSLYWDSTYTSETKATELGEALESTYVSTDDLRPTHTYIYCIYIHSHTHTIAFIV